MELIEKTNRYIVVKGSDNPKNNIQTYICLGTYYNCMSQGYSPSEAILKFENLVKFYVEVVIGFENNYKVNIDNNQNN